MTGNLNCFSKGKIWSRYPAACCGEHSFSYRKSSYIVARRIP